LLKLNPELKKFWKELMMSTLFEMLNPYGGVNRNSKLIITLISDHFPGQYFECVKFARENL
jgi:hypothetical protein